MKINLAAPILNLKGEPAKDEEGSTVTFGSVACNALCTDLPPKPGAKAPDGVEKARRGNLAMAIFGEEEAELSIDDVGLIKTLVGDLYPPLTVARVTNMIESSSNLHAVKGKDKSGAG